MPPVTRSVAVMRVFPVVAVIRPVAIVDIAVEVFRAVKPWAGTDKDARVKTTRDRNNRKERNRTEGFRSNRTDKRALRRCRC